MNKQEAIDQLKESLSKMIENIEDENDFNKGYRYATQHCFDIIKQIDEPQKVVVPKFVAEWYEEHKDNFEFNVQCLCVHDFESVREIDTWFDSDDTKPSETLVMMHKFGYEIEKEKLYTVEIPNPNLNAHTILQKTDNGIVLIVVTNARWRCCENSKLTESEIKKDFDWAWAFAKEVGE